MKLRKAINNKGFSLVELLVAAAILGFVVVPLLYSFVVSSRITNKSHNLGEATLVSKNIVETIKARGVPDIISTIDGGASPFGGTISGITWDPSAGVFEFLVGGVEAGSIEDTVTGNSRTSSYDALVTIDASAYRTGDPGAPGINDFAVTEFSPLDTMFVQPRDALDPDNLAINEFVGNISALGVPVTPADIDGEYSREIRINATHDGINASIIVRYSYFYTHPVLGAFDYHVEYDIYWEYYDFTDPNPIYAYIFYRPYYSNSGTDIDLIIINNLDMLDLTVFVVKQRPSGMTDANILTYAPLESSYMAGIFQFEHISMLPFAPMGYTTIYSNFRENFVEPDNVTPAHFQHRVRYGPYIATGTMNSDLLVSQSVQDRLFDVRIEVFEEGESASGRPIARFDASHLE